MKKLVFPIFLTSVGLIMASAEAQTPPDLQDKIVTSCANYFENIQSLDYSVKETWKPSGAFREYTGEDPTKFEGTTFTWKYVSFQKKFRIDEASYDPSGVLKERNSVAFDGETFQDLMSDGTLYLTKKVRSDLSH
jgi:hypothetical protein